MRVSLIDIDSTIPNLALMKISAYYKAGGATVGFNIDDPDRAFISVIFKKNRGIANQSANMLKALYPNVIIDIGGPGYDLTKTLPQAIEDTAPDYALYPNMGYALGFTTRGCIRACPFCVVPKKEGKLRRVNSIENIYRPELPAIKLLDNNVLADPDNFKHIVDFCADHNVKLDVSQGLDIRLLTSDLAEYVARIKPLHKLDFAFDSLAYKDAVKRGIDLLKDAGVNVRGNVQFYVYCDKSVTGEYGFNSALERCQLLKSWGTNAYVMLDINADPSREMKNLKRWANRKAIYWTVDFSAYHYGAVA